MPAHTEEKSCDRSRTLLATLFLAAATVAACGGGGNSDAPAPNSGGGGAAPPPAGGGGTVPPPSGGGGSTPPPSGGGGGATPPPPAPPIPTYEEVRIPAIDGFWTSGGKKLQVSGRGVAGQPSWSSFFDATANVFIDFDFDDDQSPVADGQLSGWTIEYSLAPDPTVHRFEFLDNSRARDSRAPTTTYENRFVPELTNGAWCIVGDTGKGFVFPYDGSLPDRQTDFLNLGLQFTAQGTEIGTGAPVQLVFNVASLPSSPDGQVVSFTYSGTSYSGAFKGVSTMSLTSTSGASLVLQRSKRTDCTL